MPDTFELQTTPRLVSLAMELAEQVVDQYIGGNPGATPQGGRVFFAWRDRQVDRVTEALLAGATFAVELLDVATADQQYHSDH